MEAKRLTYEEFAAGVEIEPFPGNEYEIAPGVFGRMKRPTLDAMDAFEAADQPMADLMRTLHGGGEEAQDEAARSFARTLYQTAITCAKAVLELEQEVDWSACYPQIATVVRAHFFSLGWPIARKLTESLQAAPASQEAA